MSLQEAYKVVLIGESSVGKTCIINQYIYPKFDRGAIISLTGQFVRKNINLSDGKEITCDIWGPPIKKGIINRPKFSA